MNRFIDFILVFGLLFSHYAYSQDRIYRCGEEYTNMVTREQEKNCVLITTGSLSKVEKQRATEKPSAERSGSFLKFALGKKWSVRGFPCDLNGGAYHSFDKKKGYRFVVGGKETVNTARSSVEYKDLDEQHFIYIQTFFSNELVEKMLNESNIVTIKNEWIVERLSYNTMVVHAKNTTLNFDLMLKGIKSYEIKNEDWSVSKLCPSQ